MYKRESGNWLKHGDFIILDILCIQIALLVAYMFRNGFEFPWKNDTYQQMAFREGDISRNLKKLYSMYQQLSRVLYCSIL